MNPLEYTATVGSRVRRMRQLMAVGQKELAKAVGVPSGTLSMIENGRAVCPPEILDRIAKRLECGPGFLTRPGSELLPTRPWLRAYADAPQRVLDRQMAEVSNVVDVIEALRLRRVPLMLPDFYGDLNDPADIESFAGDVRAAADLGEGDIVGNSIRTAERLGCVVIPMSNELGPRHLGMSTRFGSLPIICVSRPSEDPDRHVPGDRQRFTVAHELGHLTLHSGLDAPATAQDSRAIERHAHRFAAAFLAPADAMLEDLEEIGRGRVTLKTLQGIKSRWGIAIKALVGRFRDLGVIDDDQAVSLFKQISARGWTKVEPVPAGNESAVWLKSALREQTGDLDAAVRAAAQAIDLPRHHIERWLNWSPTSAATASEATILPFTSGTSERRRRSR